MRVVYTDQTQYILVKSQSSQQLIYWDISNDGQAGTKLSCGGVGITPPVPDHLMAAFKYCFFLFIANQNL